LSEYKAGGEKTTGFQSPGVDVPRIFLNPASCGQRRAVSAAQFKKNLPAAAAAGIIPPETITTLWPCQPFFLLFFFFHSQLKAWRFSYVPNDR
jgi:hypothetical protein